jgi:hypothetical protein
MVERTVAAALDRSAVVENKDSTGVRLLASCRTLFEQTERIWFDDLVERLNQMVDEDWSGWNKGKGITRAQVRELLKKFDIKNDVVYIGVDRKRGFQSEWFDDAFARYLPSVPPEVGEKVTARSGSQTQSNEVTVFSGTGLEALLNGDPGSPFELDDAYLAGL